MNDERSWANFDDARILARLDALKRHEGEKCPACGGSGVVVTTQPWGPFAPGEATADCDRCSEDCPHPDHRKDAT